MSKVIVVDKCIYCPYCTTTTIRKRYVPKCSKSNKVIPHEPEFNAGRVTEIPKKIPVWCPLQDGEIK